MEFHTTLFFEHIIILLLAFPCLPRKILHTLQNIAQISYAKERPWCWSRSAVENLVMWLIFTFIIYFIFPNEITIYLRKGILYFEKKYSRLWNQESLLTVLWGPSVVLRIKPKVGYIQEKCLNPITVLSVL